SRGLHLREHLLRTEAIQPVRRPLRLSGPGPVGPIDFPQMNLRVGDQHKCRTVTLYAGSGNTQLVIPRKFASSPDEANDEGSAFISLAFVLLADVIGSLAPSCRAARISVILLSISYSAIQLMHVERDCS